MWKKEAESRYLQCPELRELRPEDEDDELRVRLEPDDERDGEL